METINQIVSFVALVVVLTVIFSVVIAAIKTFFVYLRSCTMASVEETAADSKRRWEDAKRSYDRIVREAKAGINEEMSKLPIAGTVAHVCPKCGSDKIGRKYRPQILNVPTLDLCGSVPSWTYVMRPSQCEAIERICKCGFLVALERPTDFHRIIVEEAVKNVGTNSL